MHFFDDATNVLWNRKPMVNKNSSDHQDSFLGLHLAVHIAAESPTAGLDIPRCQRGGKCAL